MLFLEIFVLGNECTIFNLKYIFRIHLKCVLCVHIDPLGKKGYYNDNRSWGLQW